METLIRKLTSRKLWVAIAGIATGICMILGGDGSDVNNVAGAVTALGSAVAYIIAEGKVDAASAKTAVESAQTAVETIKGVDE